MNEIVSIDRLEKRFAGVAAVSDLSFAVPEGMCLSLLGPSGCGKTTTLRMIAGFVSPDGGNIRIDGVDMQGRRPYERNIGLVFQDYALFPHMTVEENVRYGMRYRNVPRDESNRRLADLLALVKMSGFERRYPRALSGGEQQRVALARALAVRPTVLLLDEPMSNLDAKLREAVRVDLKEILSAAGITTIIVTHDQQEAMSIADTIVVMEHGHAMQIGTPEQIYLEPDNRFVADFVGRMNWFRATRLEGLDGGMARYRTGDDLEIVAPDSEPGDDVHFDIGVRPERMSLASPGPGDSANSVETGVVASEHLGADVHLWVETATGQRLLVATKYRGEALPIRGEAVRIEIEAAGCVVLRANVARDDGKSSRSATP